MDIENSKGRDYDEANSHNRHLDSVKKKKIPKQMTYSSRIREETPKKLNFGFSEFKRDDI